MAVDKQVKRLYDQDFEELRKLCLEQRVLFEDPKFPADQSGFYANFDHMMPKPLITWLRPGELSPTPAFFADGTSRFDCRQGNLSDCWFVGSASSFADFRMHSKSTFHNVVPDDQGFGDNYAGIFHFRFWHYGEWMEVVIDDRLPTTNGVLKSLSSSNIHEFWSALMEKAYAKLYGSYTALSFGFGGEALVDFTGAFCTDYVLEDGKDIFDTLLKAYEEKALMGCGTGITE